MVQLGAEILSLEKLTILQCRSIGLIREIRICWVEALECFERSAELWDRLPSDGGLADAHGRLLHRICSSARDRITFHHVSAEERITYQKRKAEPLPAAGN
jgi:hypothetical protein